MGRGSVDRKLGGVVPLEEKYVVLIGVISGDDLGGAVAEMALDFLDWVGQSFASTFMAMDMA